MTISKTITIKKLLNKKVSVLLILPLFILFISTLLQLFTATKVTSAYIVNFKTESQALEFCKQFQNNQELITPYNLEIPISNFHEITTDALDHIRKRLIDNDLRSTTLLKKLMDFFYLSANENQFSIRLYAKTKIADRLLRNKLQKEQIHFSKIPIHTTSSNNWIVIFLFIVAGIIIINIQSSYSKKLVTILFFPWFIFMFISSSAIFTYSVLILLLTSMNSIVLYYDKKIVNNKLPLFPFLELFLGIILSFALIVTSWELIIYYLVCMLSTYALYTLENRAQKKKEHRIPFFVKIVPEQPRWLLYNKVVVLTTGLILIAISNLFSSNNALISLSEYDYDMHIQKQYLSIYGSIYNAPSKPSISVSNDTVQLIYSDPLDDANTKNKNRENIGFNQYFTQLSSSQPLLNAYSLLLFGIICICILLDVLFSAGKKIQKLIYFKNSVKKLPDGITITITDASI